MKRNESNQDRGIRAVVGIIALLIGLFAVGGFLRALLIIVGPVWVPKVQDLEPTTMVWLERAESLAVAACLPLALQVIGVFAMIRGLG